MQGRVKWFNNTKGFGFIECDKQDYFVHFKEINSDTSYKSLKENDKVEFSPFKSEKGLVAQSVKII